MRWFRQASMDVYVSGLPTEDPISSIQTLSHLGFYLDTQVINMLHKMMPPDEYANWRKVARSETVSIDGTDVDAQSGTINFYVEGLPEFAIQKGLEAIRFYARAVGARMGEARRETFRDRIPSLRERGHTEETIRAHESDALRVIRIPAEVRPETADRPPTLNLANSNMYFLITQVLNLPNSPDGTWTISVSDMMTKIAMASRFVVEQRAKERQQEHDEETAGHPNWVFQRMEPERIERWLAGLEAICRWALAHHYDSLLVA